MKKYTKKSYLKFHSIKIKKKKNSQKLAKKDTKKIQKFLPGLAKNFFFPIKLKISTNLFSMKIKKNYFFLGLGEKNT